MQFRLCSEIYMWSSLLLGEIPTPTPVTRAIYYTQIYYAQEQTKSKLLP